MLTPGTDTERHAAPMLPPDRAGLAPLRILHLNKFHWVKGGSERYFFDVMDLLARGGHSAIPLSMAHERNLPSSYHEHFVSAVDFHAGGSIVSRLRRAGRFVYSREAKARVKELIHRERPDVAHLHNIAHQLTPAVIDALEEAEIPIVQTLHDYKLICSSYLLYANGRTCQRCRGRRHHNAIFQRCHHGSLAKSVLGFAEMTLHELRKSYRPVQRFLCPSRFLQRTCADFGIEPRRLEHLPYFVNVERYRPRTEPGSYALYVGRLSREKGVETLIDAAGMLRTRPLVVVGDGPSRPELETRGSRTGAEVSFLGYLEGEALHERIRGAAFVVVPSEWYENLPYAVLEAFALGKPVLGSRIGGIPELVFDGETGQLFEPGNADDLARAWDALASSKELVEMGRAARRRIETEFDAFHHLSRLTNIYRGLAA